MTTTIPKILQKSEALNKVLGYIPDLIEDTVSIETIAKREGLEEKYVADVVKAFYNKALTTNKLGLEQLVSSLDERRLQQYATWALTSVNKLGSLYDNMFNDTLKLEAVLSAKVNRMVELAEGDIDKVKFSHIKNALQVTKSVKELAEELLDGPFVLKQEALTLKKTPSGLTGTVSNGYSITEEVVDADVVETQPIRVEPVHVIMTDELASTIEDLFDED